MSGSYPAAAKRCSRDSSMAARRRSLSTPSTLPFCLGIYSLLRGGLFTSLAAIPSQPVWSLAGGLIGACALFSYVVLAPKIGFSALLGLAIVGQLLSSQVIDHFGLLGAVRRPVSLLKLGGMLIMLAGLAIMLFGDRLSERFMN
ncbi:DMT family transporter [Enterobacter hormaechei]|uniref:DMT family transporter n=1 Tax=Enterobacter hormaechei TaxID=158836 RepID=UPI001F2352EF|nr:DMT family transporter [Enterobacter hormaechei]